jgi:hypothetical protein
MRRLTGSRAYPKRDMWDKLTNLLLAFATAGSTALEATVVSGGGFVVP